MIKIEIRAATILFWKRKARQKRDEEKKLLEKFDRLQDQIRANFNEVTKAELIRPRKKQTCENSCHKNPRYNSPKQNAMV